MSFLLVLIAFLALTGILPVLIFLIVTRWKQRKPSDIGIAPHDRNSLDGDVSVFDRVLPGNADDKLSLRGYRTNRVWTVIQVLFVILVIVGLAPEFISHPAGPVSSKLGRSLREYPRDRVSLNEFTNFDWSEVLVFPDYSRRAGICTQLRIDGWDCWWIAPTRVPEGELFFVFVDGTRIVHSEFHSYRDGYFEPKAFPVVRYPRGTQFQVETGRNGEYLTLRQIDK